MGKSSFRKCAICGTVSRERNMRVGPMGALFCGDEAACEATYGLKVEEIDS